VKEVCLLPNTLEHPPHGFNVCDRSDATGLIRPLLPPNAAALRAFSDPTEDFLICRRGLEREDCAVPAKRLKLLTNGEHLSLAEGRRKSVERKMCQAAAHSAQVS
jgi:hypothetical protein